MILKNLLTFIKQNKAVFIIFLLVEIFTLVAFFSVFNYSLKFAEEAKELQTECRSYSFSVSDATELDEQMSKFYSKYSDTIALLYALVANGDDVVYAVYNSDYYDDRISLGTNISSDDLTNGAKKIVIHSDADFSGDEYSIGSCYTLCGTDYEVVGITYTGSAHLIPYTSLADKSLLTEITVVTNCDLTTLKASAFVSDIENIFQCTDVEKPSAYDTNVYDQTVQYVSVFGIIILVALFNIIYLYAYMLNRRGYEFAVMRICGCSTDTAVSMYYIEVLILSTGVFAVALAVHLLCVMPLMSSISPSFGYYISTKYFILSYIVYLAVETVAFVPVISKFAKTPPSSLARA